MAQLATINPLNQFFALDGSPLNNGKLYFGVVNGDPEQDPVQMYWDSAALVPALQPIRTTSGYPSRSGSPAILYCASEYSIRVLQPNDVQVFYVPRAGSAGLQEFGQWEATSVTPAFVSASSFTVTGDQTADFQVGRRARFVVTAGTVYGTITAAVYGSLTTITVDMDDGQALDEGLESVDLSILTPDDPAIPSTLTYITSINGQQYTRGGVRQTVQSGSVDSSGLPNFLTTAASLNLPIAATSSNLVISAAGGFNLNGPVDRIGIVTADTTLALAASSTLYIYADVATAGTVTFGSTTLEPSYIVGGTPSTTNGQFTFDITKMTGYVGNGSSAVQTYRTFIGEAVTSGSAVTSVVNYALNGKYAQVDSGIPTNTRLSKTHNIGVLPRFTSIMLRCTTSDAGYAVGEDASVYFSNGNASTSSTTKYAVGIIFNVGTIAVCNKSTGAVANIATGQWDTAFYLDRGW